MASLNANTLKQQMQQIAANQVKRADATLTAAQQLAAQAQPKPDSQETKSA